MNRAGDAFRDPDPPRGLHVELEHPTREVDLDRLETVLRYAAGDQGFDVEYLAVILTGREAVHELNRTYLGHDHPTDVVSFPLEDDAVERRAIHGEVYVDLDTAAARAPEFEAGFEEEAFRYAVHGTLHLMGFDDDSDEERQQMRALEDQYVRGS